VVERLKVFGHVGFLLGWCGLDVTTLFREEREDS
jgi:hypothetical protein